MTSKKLLKFYFGAQRLNDAMDELLLRAACASATGGDAELCARQLCELIGCKCRLAELWSYLDGVMRRFGGRTMPLARRFGDRQVLLDYSRMRCGLSKLSADRKNEVRRVVVRFMRGARSLGRYAEALAVLNKYFVLTGR